jgi:hypothetical protein
MSLNPYPIPSNHNQFVNGEQSWESTVKLLGTLGGAFFEKAASTCDPTAQGAFS